MGFKELMQKELEGKLSLEQLQALPSGYQQLENIIIIKLKPELQKEKKEIAKAIASIFPYAKTIMQIKEIQGKFRKPKIEFLLGEKKFTVNYKENNCIFQFDVHKIMWAKGNKAERLRIAGIVKEGETVVDFFAGIGYWTVPILKAGKAGKVIAFEHNPEAVKFLRKNLELNKIKREKFKVMQGDCRKLAKKFPAGIADRILLGLIPAPSFALPEALRLVKNNGAIHYEGTAIIGKPEELFKDVEKACGKAGCRVFLENAQFVKDYAPKVGHYTLDVRIKKE
ncbi:MAG: methyltransferase domain-containing protein [Candidatus Diapherotrites archaeon]|uniref:Methyltransferase domain-containing protein n=1 Tax=Candidatus Iainarchaeum sp. TaxID=3101447 RepID=A0A7J4K286_9ARCH|nr:methyltransferase domain-containing protein [Candidatus Diapherotrites archaeon]HIH21626.1 methyltransferase domain-containing protein [Candidatus Diapherotrites archaeon]HIH33135.1 methyltransferase domain-containing protein [Candidatus Diapherotrites archaeon]